ncbi:hypothetical protein LA080_002453 [Diaporthe eres]|nr:hypothetical protein LA080_002453 [Diaporthe eres]
MCVPRSSILSGNTSRSRRFVELINAQPFNVRHLALLAISRTGESNPAVLDTALDDPNLFIRHIRNSIERAATSPLPGNSPAGSRTRALMGLLRSEPTEVRQLAHAVLLSAEDDASPSSHVGSALDDPRGFIQQMRIFAQLHVQPDEVPPNNVAQQPVSQSGTSQPRSSVAETLEGLDPEAFHSLPDDIRAEILSFMPPDPQPPQRGPVDEVRPAPEIVHPGPESASPSSSTAHAGERIEEVSWPRIHEWLQTRTGPRPLVLCVWCQEQVVISDGDLQPENGEREPSFQLPCSHVVGQRCLQNSLELYGIRVDRCPYCRADIGDVYR